MRTEADIIYAIWDIVRGGETNADDPINERLMRSFLSIHRGRHLAQRYNFGLELPDEVFQYLGNLPVIYDPMKKEFVSQELPKMIQLRSYSGIMVDIEGYVVSVVGSEEYRTSMRDQFNSNHPVAKIMNNRLVMRNGKPQANQLNDHSGSELNWVVNKLSQEALGGISTVNIQAVLVNPDDEPGYDWTSSVYPYPDELVEDLINSVNAREFNLYLRAKGDEVGNMRNDASQYNQPEEL